uniref:BTB domain-containing protein n=1 Tax=Panagrolaimus davidi TaxID=227884 RepID=A0A914PLM1_9BILA
MCSKDFLKEMQCKLNEAFESQIPELFDVVFDVGGKKLYAEKLRLTLASTTFESMLSDRWTSKNDIISIKDYSFIDFKELLSFIYSGTCNINDSNIMEILDMAEFYQIEHLKELCDAYLSKIEYTMDNIFKFIELSNKYSLVQIKKPIHDFIVKTFSTFFKSDGFFKADKTIIKEILSDKAVTAFKHGEIFQAVYEWAENQATKKRENSNNEIFNMNNAIKSEIQDFLPYIQFKKMRSSFLQKFVVKKDFLFTKDELNDILEYLHSIVTVKVTNAFGESIYGNLLSQYSDVIKAIKSLKNHQSDNRGPTLLYWENVMKCKIPSSPSQFKKNEDVKNYLVVFSNGAISVVHNPGISYILAEMTSEKYFEFTPKCKIEIE